MTRSFKRLRQSPPCDFLPEIWSSAPNESSENLSRPPVRNPSTCRQLPPSGELGDLGNAAHLSGIVKPTGQATVLFGYGEKRSKIFSIDRAASNLFADSACQVGI